VDLVIDDLREMNRGGLGAEIAFERVRHFFRECFFALTMPCSCQLASVRHANFARAVLSRVEIENVQRCRNPFADTSAPFATANFRRGSFAAEIFPLKPGSLGQHPTTK
jgi:hypothetical protein